MADAEEIARLTAAFATGLTLGKGSNESKPPAGSGKSSGYAGGGASVTSSSAEADAEAWKPEENKPVEVELPTKASWTNLNRPVEALAPRGSASGQFPFYAVISPAIAEVGVYSGATALRSAFKQGTLGGLCVAEKVTSLASRPSTAR